MKHKSDPFTGRATKVARPVRRGDDSQKLNRDHAAIEEEFSEHTITRLRQGRGNVSGRKIA